MQRERLMEFRKGKVAGKYSDSLICYVVRRSICSSGQNFQRRNEQSGSTRMRRRHCDQPRPGSEPSSETWLSGLQNQPWPDANVR